MKRQTKAELKTKDPYAVGYLMYVNNVNPTLVMENGTATFILERTSDNLNLYRHYCNESKRGLDSDLNEPYAKVAYYQQIAVKMKREFENSKKGTKVL